MFRQIVCWCPVACAEEIGLFLLTSTPSKHTEGDMRQQRKFVMSAGSSFKQTKTAKWSDI